MFFMQLIDAFVQDEPVMTEQEKKWCSVTRSVMQPLVD